MLCIHKKYGLELYNLLMKKHLFGLACAALLSNSYSVIAASESSNSSTSNINFFATVNNTMLTKGLLDLNIKAAVAQGQKNTPELQKALKDELINRELLAQQAERKDLEKGLDLEDQYTQLRQTLLIQALVENHFKQSPITDAQLRQEYDRQRKLTGDATSGYQYRVSEIVVNNESDAIDLINRINKGELFGKLAQQFSITEGAKSNGGQLGWLFPGQLNPELQQLVAKLNKGATYGAPIQVQGGWAIIKLDDKRNYKLPGFEESKPQLRQAFVQQYLVETVKDLRGRARITQ
jgi:peptidyl-prolyl cis-trans isomerase C